MQKLFDTIKIKPKKIEIFEKAFTHKSYSNSYKSFGNYNMLEFLGDSILQFKVSDYIYKKFPEIEEGEATLLRANNVNTKALSKMSKMLELNSYVKVSKNSEIILINPKIQADLFESLVAAIYLDQGQEVLDKFLGEFLYPNVDLSYRNKAISIKDPKTTFQEFVQHFTKRPVEYISTKLSNGNYESILKHENKIYGRGIGKSKKEAETAAAAEALEKMS